MLAFLKVSFCDPVCYFLFGKTGTIFTTRAEITKTQPSFLRSSWSTARSASPLSAFTILFICLFIFSCAGSLGRRLFSSCSKQGLLSSCGVQASHLSGLFRCGAQALGTRASVVAARGPSSCGSWTLEHRLSSYSAQA